ncbi:MAG: hypothetical protein KDB03_14680 [Planctomycetales bacterium]|nr:hypothetical protein [Planctomycetales bacterium]
MSQVIMVEKSAEFEHLDRPFRSSLTDERPKSRGCGHVTYHQETRDRNRVHLFVRRLFCGACEL